MVALQKKWARKYPTERGTSLNRAGLPDETWHLAMVGLGAPDEWWHVTEVGREAPDEWWHFTEVGREAPDRWWHLADGGGDRRPRHPPALMNPDELPSLRGSRV
jgi:hypothetical protein